MADFDGKSDFDSGRGKKWVLVLGSSLGVKTTNGLGYLCLFQKKSKVHSFWGVIAFLQHAPRDRRPPKWGFPLNSREIVQIVGGQRAGSMHIKRSDPDKD